MRVMSVEVITLLRVLLALTCHLLLFRERAVRTNHPNTLQTASMSWITAAITV